MTRTIKPPNEGAESVFNTDVFLYVQTAETRKYPAVRCDKVLSPEGGIDEGIVAFLDPLYAHIDKPMIKVHSPWKIEPFHQIDPTYFITTHNYVLRVLMTYGFAAAGNKLVRTIDMADNPRGLVGIHTFSVPRTAIKKNEFMTFQFGALNFVEDIYSRSRIADYDKKLIAMRDWSDEDFHRAATDALSCADFCAHTDDYTHTALYDFDNRRWNFVPFRPYLVKNFPTI